MRDRPFVETCTSQTHCIHNRQNIHTPEGFEPAIPGRERPQTCALDRTAIGTGTVIVKVPEISCFYMEIFSFIYVSKYPASPSKFVLLIPIEQRIGFIIHSFSILSDDRSKASSKTMPPYSAMQSLLLQMRISSPVLKVIQ